MLIARPEAVTSDTGAAVSPEGVPDGAVGSGSVGRGMGSGNIGGDDVLDGVVVRGNVLDGIAGMDVVCLAGLLCTWPTHTTTPRTTATAKPAAAHSQGRGPRGGSGG